METIEATRHPPGARPAPLRAIRDACHPGGCLKTARHYLDQASYMRDLAKSTEIETFRASCLRAAAKYESLARSVAQERAEKQDEEE